MPSYKCGNQHSPDPAYTLPSSVSSFRPRVCFYKLPRVVFVIAVAAYSTGACPLHNIIQHVKSVYCTVYCTVQQHLRSVYCTVYCTVQCFGFPRDDCLASELRPSPRFERYLSPDPDFLACRSLSETLPSFLQRPPLPTPPLLPLGPAPPPPRPLPPCDHACTRSLRSSSRAKSLNTIRVSGFSRLQGKNLHFGRVKRQFPRCGRKSLHTMRVRTALSAARSSSLAPAAPSATFSHTLSTVSSCACVQPACHVINCFPSHPSVIPQTPYSIVTCLLLLFHRQ
eukprot:2101858-Pleurochrysis_carterae.AAC.1